MNKKYIAQSEIKAELKMATKRLQAIKRSKEYKDYMDGKRGRCEDYLLEIGFIWALQELIEKCETLNTRK